MCSFFSCIVTETGDCFYSSMTDSHDEILRENKIVDDTSDPEKMAFARIEITPPDGDVFRPVKEWTLRIDQSITPKWWSKFYEKIAFDTLKKFLKSALIVGKEIEKIEAGRFWIRDCKIGTVGSFAVIELMCGSAVINDVYGSAVIHTVRDSAVINDVYGSAVIKYVCDSAVINDVRDSAVINGVRGSAVIHTVRDSAVINDVYGSAVINDVRDSAVINGVRGSAIAIIRTNKINKIICSDKDLFVLESHKKTGGNHDRG